LRAWVIDEERVKISCKRGLPTICADATTFNPPEKIDVYYMWMGHELIRSVFNNIKEGVIIMAAELKYGTRVGYPRGVEAEILDQIRYEYPESQMLNVKYNEGDGERQTGVMCLLIVRKRPKKMKNLMVYFNPEKRFSAEVEDLVKRQIINSLRMGWKRADIVLLTDFPYKYKGVEAKIINPNLFRDSEYTVQKSNVIYHLLEEKMVHENELWLYHDLDFFQLHPIDGSEISLQGGLAGFVEDDSSKFNLNRFFFRKGSHKIFEWIRNRALKLQSSEAVALASLVTTNYRNINSFLKRLKPSGIFDHTKLLLMLLAMGD